MAGRIAVLMSIAAELRIGGVLPPIIYGVAYSETLFQIGGVGTLVYDDPGALVLPAGIIATDNGDGTLTFAGISTASGLYPITVTGLDGDRNPVTASFVLTVQVLPIVITGDAGDMRVGDSDSYSYGISGGSGTGYDWHVVVGTSPLGWTLNPSTGVWTRVPTSVGAYTWGIQVTDSLGNVSATFFDSAIIRYPVITLTGAFTALGIIGVAYQSDILITGGDGIYSNPRCTSANLPAGLALSIVTVSGSKYLRLSGTPTTHVTASITVAVDAHEVDGSVVTATHSQSVTEDPALTLTGTFASAAVVGIAYQSDILLGGGDGTYSLHGGTGISSGALPGGLALSIVTVSSLKYARLSGTPTTAAANAFTLSIDSGDGQNVTGAQSITVNAALAISGALANAEVGVAYQSDLTISGGTAPYTLHGGTGISSGSLASGLALSIVNVSGTYKLRVSGTPTASAVPDAVTFSVDSTDGQNATSAQSFNDYAALSLGTSTFASPLYDGVSYSQSIPITGGNGSFSLTGGTGVISGALPSGLSLSISGTNLVLSGTCTSGTTSTFTVGVTDSLGATSVSASQSLTRQDDKWANVILALHGNGANGGTVITDQKGTSWTVFTGATTSTAQAKYGGSSVAFPGTAGIQTAAAWAHAFGSNEFCIDSWIYPTSATDGEVMCHRGSGAGTNFWLLRRKADATLRFAANNGSSFIDVVTSATVPANAWTFVRVQRRLISGVLTLEIAIGGTYVSLTGANGTSAFPNTSGIKFVIGTGDAANAPSQFTGYGQQFRVLLGDVRNRGSNFTPPADAFPDS